MTEFHGQVWQAVQQQGIFWSPRLGLRSLRRLKLRDARHQIMSLLFQFVVLGPESSAERVVRVGVLDSPDQVVLAPVDVGEAALELLPFLQSLA